MVMNNKNRVALCPSGEDIYAAVFDLEGGIAVKKLFANKFTFGQELRNFCAEHGIKVSMDTVFFFPPTQFTEQTKVVEISEEEFEGLDEKGLTEWFLNAASMDRQGDDGKALFPSPLTKSAYDYCRLPTGMLTLTEVSRDRIKDAVKNIVALEPVPQSEIRGVAGGGSGPVFLHGIETRLRASARACVSEFADGGEDEGRVTGFLTFTEEGAVFGLYSGAWGFFAEDGEIFHLQYDAADIPDDMEESEYKGELYVESVGTFLEQAVLPRITDDGGKLLFEIREVFWDAGGALPRVLAPIIDNYFSPLGIGYPHLEGIAEERVVRGLLLGTVEETSARVMPVNLANDLSVQASEIEAGKINERVRRDAEKSKKAVAALIVPVIAAAGLVGGVWLNQVRVSASLESRKASADNEVARLKPVLEARESYERTLSWYQDIIRQIAGLRKRQAAGLSFSSKLDALYPENPSFYIASMKLAPGGGFEIQGMTREKDAVTQFVRTVEAALDEREQKLFTGLQVDFKEDKTVPSFTIKGQYVVDGGLKPNASVPAPQPAASSSPGSAAPQSAQPQPNAPAQPGQNPQLASAPK